MEQKAVTYKTIKGMARDMALSSGSNDFAYENYNIRITTRGKEDSLVVTNEKGTESNIIATKDVLKTVNNLFVGMQPGFYNNFTALDSGDDIRRYDYTELYKKVGNDYIQLTQEEYFDDEITKYKSIKQNEIQQLDSTNGIIKYSLNTEYPVDSDLKAKGIFAISETPIKYQDEDLYLLNNGEYSIDTEIQIPANDNTFLATQDLKNIVLNDNAGTDDGSLDDGETVDDKDWMDTYKNLYKKITDRSFALSGFDSRINDITYASTDSLSHISISINSFNTLLPTGTFKPDEAYSNGTGIMVNDPNDVKHLQINVPKLSLLTNTSMLSKNYPTNTKLTANQYVYYFYTPIFKKVQDTDTYSSTASYHNLADFIKTSTTDDIKYVEGSTFKVNATEDNFKKYYIMYGYLKATITFDVNKFFGNSVSQTITTIHKLVSGSSEQVVSGATAVMNYSYTNSSPSSAAFGFYFKNIGQDIIFFQPKGPFYKENVVISSTAISGIDIPDISIGNSITLVENTSSSNIIEVAFGSSANDYVKCDGSGNLPSGYAYKSGSNYSQIEYNSNTYNVSKYEILSTAQSSYSTEIQSITTEKENDNYVTKISISNSQYLVYDKQDNTIRIGENGTKHYIYEMYIENCSIPFIVYSTAILEDIEEATTVYKLSYSNSTLSFAAISNSPSMLPSDLTSDFVSLKSNNGLITRNGTTYSFIYTESSTTKSTNVSSLNRISYLPIFETGGYIDTTPKVTEIDSYGRTIYENPNYNTIVNYFKFKTNNFKPSISVQAFRLKRSNNNWDDKFVYNFLSENSDFVDYTKKFIPMSVLDTFMLSLRVELSNVTGYNNVVTFFIDIKNPDEEYFGLYNKQIDITIGDNSSKHYEFTSTLAELINGVVDTRFPNADLKTHTFYIKSITQHDVPSESDLEIEDIKDNIGFEDSYNGSYNVTLQILKGKNTYAGKKYARQIVDYGTYKTTSTIEFSFGSTYLNKFFSPLSNDLLVANFGEYQALTIPGRILGSCTIDDYVVLFFHYSSPALNWYYYDANDDIYVLLAPNADTSGYDKLYTRNAKMGFDLAAVNQSLLRDDNNDYINGKNQDYIVKLKYIDARPENKENEWTEIVSQIANVPTQSTLVTDITQKKPYYSADILYHGNLKFNANNGIETIGYYESKDVIKVYFTDGRNQPRMIDIMTPFAKRNGLHRKWDNKSFDFIQEISGNEKYEITKQFGGGAFPSGTIQYYFTYSNLGGCETNPFLNTPLYYTSESDTGNSPMKITDNTFKIKLKNLSNRFDYVNIYSVVRSTKDAQPYCKKVIYLSLNGKTEIEFTDNNLLGETVDHTYLLMLQGTPINALTFAEKDNTLFLGNINKLQKNISQEDKDKIKTFFDVEEGMREYQNYNPNEESWYENKVKDKVKLNYYGDEVVDEQGDNVIVSKISLEENSSEIKTFMYNEYYRLGIQLQDKFGRWSDPIFIKDVKCEKTINTTLTEQKNDEENITDVTNIKSETPYFYMVLKREFVNDFNNILNDYGYIRVRPVIVYPNISSRNVLCQGLLNPTMFNYADRSINGPFNFSSYFFRPIPPAMSTLKDEHGNSLHNPDMEKEDVCGYPIEYRHGYPINGWHEAIEEGLARDEQEGSYKSDVKNIVSAYLKNIDLTSVNLTSNTIGWWIDSHRYFREGEMRIEKITINGNPSTKVTYKSGGKIYLVETGSKRRNGKKMKGIKGDIYLDETLSSDMVNNDYPSNTGMPWDEKVDSWNQAFGRLLDSQRMNNMQSRKTMFGVAFGFKSHMHYFRAAASMFFNPASVLLAPSEIIKSIGHTHCDFIGNDYLITNEGNTYYEIQFPIKIKITPKQDIKLKKHNGIKRKTYFVDIKIESEVENGIKVYSDSKSAEKYIDSPDGEYSVATSKAYFANNSGEIQCANGNKDYNLFSKIINKVDETYDSTEANVDARKQSLFYVDESICTLNSPEIEYDATVQKIDLSTYKLNIVGAANITGYANKIDVDTETPPATAGTTICEGFKYENSEVKNFNREAYRYILSGGYWYDNVFYEGDDENPENKNDNAELITNQYCWWVYPFNRQILNNSKEGSNGKLRTKKWVNYHYSAFSDYFGKASVDYNLLDAQQLYGDLQVANIDTLWTNTKCLYYGNVDTAYTNPVPLVGAVGGSNEPNENAFEQNLAVSPHTTFRSYKTSSYSSTNFADIVPLSFRSSNHFVLSLDRYKYNYNNILPEYYSNDIVLTKDFNNKTIIQNETFYKISKLDIEGTLEELTNQYYVKNIDKDAMTKNIYKKTENGLTKVNNSYLVMYNGESNTKCLDVIISDGEFDISEQYSESTWEEITTGHIVFESEDIITEKSSLNSNNIIYDEESNYHTGSLEYVIPDSLLQSPKPAGCVKKYVKYENEKAGIYKYGHVYIAQLERGVKSADEVFSGTSESVLLQNTWIPAGKAVSVSDFSNGYKNIEWTEGDTFYQRYDCLKTFAYSDDAVNQVVEQLSAMIQTRINLDGIYSYRGNVENTGANNTNTNILNQAYSQSDNYFTYTITDPYIADITEYSNMFTWTLTKQPMSRNDNWMAINLISFYNATGTFGKITRLINYRNQLFCFQDNAISQIAYNERVALSTSDGVPIEIGNSGKVQGLNYISSNVGCQNRWSVMPSKSYLYWVDDRRAEIYRFGETLEPFSTINGFSDWVKENTYGEDWKPIKSTNVPITTYYDNNNDDIYFVTEKDCLAYNEKLNAFESFFSYEDSFILNSVGNTLVIKEQDAYVRDLDDITDVHDENDSSWWDNGIRGDGLSSIELMHEGNYNQFFGDYKPYYIRFKVYPTDLQRDKIYTNLEFNTDAFDEKDIYNPNGTFTRVRVWNEYQWGQMFFNINPYGTTNFRKRFRTFYAQLPRASYVPTGFYEDYNYLFNRQPEWRRIDALLSSDIAYHGDVNSMNDRIRNPWVWMELYNNPKYNQNFTPYVFEETEPDNKKAEYLNNRSILYFENYVEVDSKYWTNYEYLYRYDTTQEKYVVTHDYSNNQLTLYRLEYVNCSNYLIFDSEKTYYVLNADKDRMEIHDIILKYFEA